MVGKRPLRGASSRADVAHGRSLITGPEHQAHAGSQYFAAERRPTHRQVERIIRTYVLKVNRIFFIVTAHQLGSRQRSEPALIERPTLQGGSPVLSSCATFGLCSNCE